MILSIIVPVYNVEQYVEKCLLSCIRQDIAMDEYEIIVVNDGSLDRSYEIVLDYAIRYDNIWVINQVNQGLSSARNVGFQKAKGEYVWFVDSDDWIEENCLGRICSYLRDGLDILQLQYRLVYHAKNKFVKASNQGGEPTAGRFSDILKEFFMRERKYDDAGFTPEERLRERQSLETKELLIELRSLLDSELSKDSEFRSRYYREALNYLNRFWKEIFAYLDDGELPIDNNLAYPNFLVIQTPCAIYA